jgi:hypothetical protein
MNNFIDIYIQSSRLLPWLSNLRQQLSTIPYRCVIVRPRSVAINPVSAFKFVPEGIYIDNVLFELEDFPYLLTYPKRSSITLKVNQTNLQVRLLTKYYKQSKFPALVHNKAFQCINTTLPPVNKFLSTFKSGF